MSRRTEIKSLKAGIRPIIELWYKKMSSVEDDFKKIKSNEISKVTREAARKIYMGE